MANNIDDYLNQFLQNRDSKLGSNGSYSFVLSIQNGENSYQDLIAVKNLTEDAARDMFDLFDENNYLFPNAEGNVYIMKISIVDVDNTEIDFNLLPNAFS